MYGTKYFDENFLGKSQIMGNAQYILVYPIDSSLRILELARLAPFFAHFFARDRLFFHAQRRTAMISAASTGT